MSDSRRHLRHPIALEVAYRTTGSFLISYSMNLSKGGLFLETDAQLPVGSGLTVSFTVPGKKQQVEATARVMWVRRQPSPEGFPPGLGLRFDQQLETHIGHLIDELARDFAGLTLVAVAADSRSSAVLERYLQHSVTCTVEAASARDVTLNGFAGEPDLVLVDLDSTGRVGVDVVHRARAAKPPIPVMVIAGKAEAQSAAAVACPDAVFDNPPPFGDLRRMILDILARPVNR